MPQARARYREFIPHPELQPFIRALFTFSVPAEQGPQPQSIRREILFGPGESFSSPLFADGHISVSFTFGKEYRVDELWCPHASHPQGHVIGAMSKAHAAHHGDRVIQIGAYFRAAASRAFFDIPASELTDRIVAIPDLWGSSSATLESQPRETGTEASRLALLEAALVERLRIARLSKPRVNVSALANWMLQRQGRLTVAEASDAAGISRKHLRCIFLEEVGVTPKLYCRLARFRTALQYCQGGSRRKAADVAAELGYVDQSHMIAEIREFTSLTPGTLVAGRCFHPFMEKLPNS